MLTEAEVQFYEILRPVIADRCRDRDPSHDFHHVQRVVQNASTISLAEGADVSIATTAALLHELVTLPKGHPDSPRSGALCAREARSVLAGTGRTTDWIEAVAYAIEVHPYSLGIVPDTLEARVLQDADRLDALGAIGIARCFATTSEMKRPFFSPQDPFCETREPDDKQWGLDHFYKKLLRIPGTLHTVTALSMAGPRVKFVERFLDQLRRELGV